MYMQCFCRACATPAALSPTDMRGAACTWMPASMNPYARARWGAQACAYRLQQKQPSGQRSLFSITILRLLSNAIPSIHAAAGGCDAGGGGAAGDGSPQDSLAPLQPEAARDHCVPPRARPPVRGGGFKRTLLSGTATASAVPEPSACLSTADKPVACRPAVLRLLSFAAGRCICFADTCLHVLQGRSSSGSPGGGAPRAAAAVCGTAAAAGSGW